MIKVAGMWEVGWNTPFMEHDMWEYPLRDFQVDQFYMTPVSGIQKNGVTERDNLGTVINENPDLTPVWIDEDGDTLLTNFVHPTNALYLTGKTLSNPMVTYKQPHHLSVKIPTKLNSTSQGLLWSHQVIVIVLYDRLMKLLTN